MVRIALPGRRRRKDIAADRVRSVNHESGPPNTRSAQSLGDPSRDEFEYSAAANVLCPVEFRPRLPVRTSSRPLDDFTAVNNLGGHVVGGAEGLADRSPLFEILGKMPSPEQRQPESHFLAALVVEVFQIQRLQGNSKVDVAVFEARLGPFGTAPATDRDAQLLVSMTQCFNDAPQIFLVQAQRLCVVGGRYGPHSGPRVVG